MNGNPKVSIIIPTRHRAKLLEQRLKVILSHTPELSDHSAELIVVHDLDDQESGHAVVRAAGSIYPIIITSKPLETPANKWNQAASIAWGNWLVTISDDCIPQDKWLTNALRMITSGFIGLPDGVTGDRNNFFTPLYMATKDWLRKYNGGVLVIPHYKSWYADIETAMRAKNSNTYTVGRNSVITQLHEVFGTADNDEMYRLGATRRAEDLNTYNLRVSKGFPNDFDKVL
jgi:glycosyltransferase involved in cell wall biosynthesis